jgi:hypothetical protein
MIVNNRLLKNCNDWEISGEESCSDHNIIKFMIEHETNHEMLNYHNENRYIVKAQNYVCIGSNVLDRIYV